jgi:hypothetical protein
MYKYRVFIILAMTRELRIEHYFIQNTTSLYDSL